MESHDSFSLRRRGDEDIESNYSYGSADDDPILTATITFDVTVDPNGQVISASEGQIISEAIQRNDGRTLNLIEHSPLPQNDFQTTSRPDHSVLHTDNAPHDSLDEGSDTDDSASTSTDSLMEKTKKYMTQEAGIIILKRTNQNPKNFNINLDFDVENSESQSGSVLNTQDSNSKNFNINLDFDKSNSQPKVKDSAQAWVDIDLMITSSATTSKVEKLSNETFEDIKNALKDRLSTDTPYWRALNRNPSNDQRLDPSQIENDVTRESLNRSDSIRREEFEGSFLVISKLANLCFGISFCIIKKKRKFSQLTTKNKNISFFSKIN